MRTLLIPVILLVASPYGWTTDGPTTRRETREHAPSQRLLLTPTATIRFGPGTHSLDEIMASLGASTEPHVITADVAGILEYACSPRSIIAWGAPLFRVYEPDLLSDIRRAEAAAARIGDRPFVVGRRPRWADPAESEIAFPPPLMPGRTAPKPVPPPSTARRPTERGAGPAPARQPLPRPKVTPPSATLTAPQPDRSKIETAARRLTAIEERVRSLSLLAEAASDDVAAAEAAAEPIREDVDARRRLLESGVIARNSVKAAEEQLSTALGRVEDAKARLAEAESALGAAQSERDAALVDLEAARKPVAAPPPGPEPIKIVRAQPTPPTPGVGPAPSPDERAPSPVPIVTVDDDFPPPVLGQPVDIVEPSGVPGPVELRRPHDVPDGRSDPLPLPDSNGDLARARWHEQASHWQCIVTEQVALDGGRVEEGDPVVKLRETAVARLYAEVAEEHVPLCRVGAPVEVAFPREGAVFHGWVIAAEPTRSPRPPGARIEILLAKGASLQGHVYPAVEWMALTTPSVGRRPQPFTEPPTANRHGPSNAARLLPVTPAGVQALLPPAPPDGSLTGTMQLVSSKRPSGFASTDPVAKAKLERLRRWRKSFVEGMRTTVFPETGLALTYPRDGEIRRAVERMATRRVPHPPNLCAYTMREALGWGLGDAAMWASRLPSRGYRMREDGVARPGDIVVWPFTYGPTRGQHIGLAVAQGGTMMLLSNECGVLGTSRLKPGYLAFCRPRTEPDRRAMAVSSSASG